MNSINKESDCSTNIERAIQTLLRHIPERWANFDHDALSTTEQRALFLLVAAGLVERRIGVRGEFAGQAPAIEFTVDATGEYGLIEAIEPVIAEMWTKWGPAFEKWKASEAGTTTPFRFTKTGRARWRLTDQGAIARDDLDIEAPSETAAADVGSYQRAIEFVTRTGHQEDRPPVRGEGRLVELKSEGIDEAKTVAPTEVSLTNAAELAAAFRDLVIPAMAEAFRPTTDSSSLSATKTPSIDPANECIGDGETDAVVPPLTDNEVAVINTLAMFDPSRLASGATIEEEMSGQIRLSRRTIQPIVTRLIELGLVERPRGERSGVRLTLAGRRLAPKIAD